MNKMKNSKIRLRRIQPDRKVKKKPEIDWRNARKHDLIGDWISNYGLTGANLTRWIFSYMDFSTLQKGRLVCKTWCQYLTYDRILWLNILLKSRLYLEMFFNKLSHEKYKLTAALFSDFTKDFFQCIKDRNLHYEHIFKIFGDVHSIIIIIGCHNNGYRDLYDVKKKIVGKHLYEDIVVKILRGSVPFYNNMNSKLTKVGMFKNHIRYLKDEYRDIDNFVLFSAEFIQHFKNWTLHAIQSEERKIQKLLISIARNMENLIVGLPQI